MCDVSLEFIFRLPRVVEFNFVLFFWGRWKNFYRISYEGLLCCWIICLNKFILIIETFLWLWLLGYFQRCLLLWRLLFFLQGSISHIYRGNNKFRVWVSKILKSIRVLKVLKVEFQIKITNTKNKLQLKRPNLSLLVLIF